MKKRSIIILWILLLLTGCQSYKKVPYLQDAVRQAEATGAAGVDTTLYDARIMPKDLLTIVVSYPEEPELAVPFNLTVASTINANNNLNSQPNLQQYLVDNSGYIDFPVLGNIRLGGLTKGEAEQLIKEKLKPQFRETPSSPYAWPTTKFPSSAKWPVLARSPSPTKR